MAINTDKNSYTILFAIIMVVVVGSLSAFTASSLKPQFVENMRMEKQQNILYAMGVNGNEGKGDITFISTDKVANEFKTNVSEQLVLESKDGKIIAEAKPIELKEKKVIEPKKTKKEKNIPTKKILKK